MQRVEFNSNNESFDIITEKKRLFSSQPKIKVENVELKNLKEVGRELYEGQFNGMTFFMNDNSEILLDENCLGIEDLFRFLCDKAEVYGFKVTKVDVDDDGIKTTPIK